MSTQQRQGGVCSGGAERRLRAAITIIRDVTMTGLALWGVWHQEQTGKVNPWLLLTYVVILGIIPASHAVALARSAAAGQPSSPSPPAATPEIVTGPSPPA